MSEVKVACYNLCKKFGTTVVVDDLSFTVESGQVLALLGPSGCGKTTTLRLIAGFEKLDGGRIEVAGQVVADDRLHWPPERRRVGMVFQDYAIFPHLNVAQNVAFGLGRGSQAEEQVEAMLAMVGLEGLEDQMPHELSGGQQQRVALARALAPEPAVLLLDEPFSNLDTSLRSQVRAEVRDLLKKSRATAIFVTHDQEEALFIGDRVAVMQAGTLEQVGTPAEIFHEPATRFVAEFMGQSDFLPGQVTDEGIMTPLGPLSQPVALPAGTTVEVAVRPDDVTLRAEPAGANGRIVDRRFVGIATIYTVALDRGGRVHSWQPHTVELASGMAVRAWLRPDHPVAVFYQGRAVHRKISVPGT
ncbi:MAG: ABC transporter ATP-binding protein [Chloroflexi bacterium]|nr:ABC transporter ATP-binding protein [Chloroflexota bacterium]MCI0576287.1 ABC transporter ATP-binding protein [Chloroflexota bacterium]MCI0644517.1 ABC transporter ATP-binding protein [Chloroflexota bacterium]MCI0728794.1 ABC transporter ATP-binding protein [Chloroflexota bacterium]